MKIEIKKNELKDWDYAPLHNYDQNNVLCEQMASWICNFLINQNKIEQFLNYK